jgi:SPP1 gp7 family putative phage head morphogenesis protein
MAQLLSEIATRHQVYLERLKSGEANQFAAFLLEIDRSIRRRLGAANMTDFTRARLERLLAATERDLQKILDRYYDQLSGNLIELAQYEAGFEARSLEQVVRGFEVAVPAEAQVIAAVTTRPLSVRGPDGGKLLEPFIRDWSANEVKRVSGAIRQGFYEGQTTAQILQAVRGTKANQYRDGILSIVNRDAEAIVRTAVQHVASQARQITWEANADIVQGVRWVSTLDSRTTQQCRSLDGRVFAIDKGPRPPIHIRCRSTTVAELADDLAALSGGATRASVNGQVEAGETYYSWLKKQPEQFVREAIGPTRAKLLLNGGLTAERFAELNLGRSFQPLTLAEMKRLEPTAFIKAGLE